MLTSLLVEALAWLLVYGVVIRALALLITLISSRRKTIFNFTRQHGHFIAELTVVVLVLTIVLPFLASRYFTLTTPVLLFVFDTFSGNWTPDAFPGGTAAAAKISSPASFLFSASVAVAILLNNAIILSVILVAWRLYKAGRRLTMNLAKALTVKTATEITCVLHAIDKNDTNTRQRVSLAFKEAANEWREHLINMIGEEQAKEVFAALEQELPTPAP